MIDASFLYMKSTFFMKFSVFCNNFSDEGVGKDLSKVSITLSYICDTKDEFI